MSQDNAAINLDNGPFVPLAIKLPGSQYQVLRDYCRYRGHDERKIPMAAAGAIAAYFGRDRAFQEWRREHPDTTPASVTDTTQVPVVRRSRRGPPVSGDA